MFISLASFTIVAQPDLPSEYTLELAEDYEQYEETVIQSLKWLLKTPVEESVNLRAKHNAFVLIWLSGSPSINIDIDSKAMPFMEKHEDLFYTFLHGMALYALKHQDKKTDSLKNHTAGIKAVATMVEQSHAIKIDSSLRKLMKAYRKKELKDYTAKLLKED